MSLLYRAKKYITILLMLVCSATFMLHAESASEKYDKLIKSGSATDIKKALLTNSELILVRLGDTNDTLLMKAIEYNRTESVINLLIKAGVNPGTKNKKGQDALMYVCKMSQDPAVIKLIFSKSGSEKSLKKKLLRKDKTGNSAWDYANQNRGPQAAFIAKKYVGENTPASEPSSEIAETQEKEKYIAKNDPVVKKAEKLKKEKETAEKKAEKNNKPEKSTGPKGKVQKVQIATETIDEAVKVSGGKISFSDYDEDEEENTQASVEQQLSDAPVVAEKFDSYEQQFFDDQNVTEKTDENKENVDVAVEPVTESVAVAEPVTVEEPVQPEAVTEPVNEEKPASVVYFEEDFDDWEDDDPGFIENTEPLQPEPVQTAAEKDVPATETVPEAVAVAEEPVPEPEKAPEPEEPVIVAKSSFGKKKTVQPEPAKIEKSEKVEKTEKEQVAAAPEKTEKKQESPKKVSIEVPKTAVSKYSNKKYLYDYEQKQETPVNTIEDSSSKLAVISNPDAADRDGRTALMKAVKAGNDWEIKSLLKSGANVNLQDKDGWTALMYSVRYQNNIDITNLLLRNGADTRIENKYGTNALSIAACYSNNPEIIRRLLKSYPVGNKEIFKAFILAITSNSTSTITQIAKLNVFIETGIPMNRFYEGKTPLMYAAEYANSTDIIQLLLKNGALPSIRSSEGKIAFNFAEYNSQLEHNEVYWSLNNR